MVRSFPPQKHQPEVNRCLLKGSTARHTLSGEAGAIVVVSAILALTLFLVIIAIGVDTTLVKHLRQELEQKVELACHEASYRLPFQGDAYSTFEGLVTSIDLKFGEIEEWHFYSPTAPDGPLGAYSSSSLPFWVCDVDDIPHSPTLIPPYYTHDLYGLASCPNDPGVLPRFVVRSDPDDPDSAAAFPPGFWNDTQYFGTVVGCEARATYRPFWVFDSSDPDKRRSVVVRSVFWRPLAGTNFDYQQALALPPDTPTSTHPPALSIVVAPQMTTFYHPDRSQSQFRFSDSFAQSYQEYDPTVPESANPPHEMFGQKYPPPEGRDYGFGLHSDAQVLMAGHRPLTQQQANQLATACYNPAVLVRNAFTSSIAKLATRHAHTANSTEILIAGSREPGLGSARRPIRLHDYGTDLSEGAGDDSKGVQLPYIYYVNYDLEDPDDHRWIYPLVHGLDTDDFKDDSERTREEIELDFIRSAQLRFCIGGYNLSDMQAEMEIWYRFENKLEAGQELYEPIRFWQGLGLEFPTVGWEQHCPFGFGDDCPGNELTTSSYIAAMHILGTIGTIQHCPHGDFIAGSSVCTKPPMPTSSDPPFDLEPDIASVVAYQTGLELDLPPGVSLASKSPAMGKAREGDIKAILADTDTEEGLHPIPTAELGLQPTPYLSSTVLLVLHKPIVHEGEKTIIQNLLENDSRRWVIVYFPTTLYDAEQYGSIVEAFGVVDSDDTLSPGANLFFMFQPYELDDGGDIIPTIETEYWPLPGPIPDTEAEIFQQYWEALLLGEWGDNNDHIVERAIKIWNLALVDTRRKL